MELNKRQAARRVRDAWRGSLLFGGWFCTWRNELIWKTKDLL